MKKILLFSLMPIAIFANDYTWQKKYNVNQYKGNIFYINYDRPYYQEKSDYKNFSKDLSKTYKIQRKKEEALKDT